MVTLVYNSVSQTVLLWSWGSIRSTMFEVKLFPSVVVFPTILNLYIINSCLRIIPFLLWYIRYTIMILKFFYYIYFYVCMSEDNFQESFPLSTIWDPGIELSWLVRLSGQHSLFPTESSHQSYFIMSKVLAAIGLDPQTRWRQQYMVPYEKISIHHGILL